MLFSLLLVLVPGAVFGLIAISNNRTALTQAVGGRLAEEARSAVDLLSGMLHNELSELRAFARQDLMREIRIGDLDKRISASLASLKRGADSIIELRVIDLAGRTVAASDPSRIGQTALPSAPQASGAPVGESLRGPLPLVADGTQAIELAVPIPDPDGGEHPLGRLIALYDWRQEVRPLGHMQHNLFEMGLEVDILVMNGSGTVIGIAGEREVSTPPGTDLRAAGWSSAAAPEGKTAFGFVVEPSVKRIVGYERFGEGDPPWMILVVQPLSKALRPVAEMTVRLVIVLAAVLAGAIGLALLLANRIAGPLRELTLATQEIAGGTRSAPVSVPRSRDEVSQLTSAFNQMLVDLRRAQSEVLEAAKFAFVGEVAAGVAHEVRTTLGVLRSSAQILQPSVEAKDTEAAELIQIMLEEIDHLDGVVTQLLNLGRPRELTLAPTHLADVVLRAADFVEPQARGRGVALRRVISDGRVVALCDEEMIYQVALNLIVNAIQVLSPGGEVTVALLPARSRMTGFEVRDDGPGIPPDMQEKIFLPFFTRRDGGVGLGLTFVQRVIREHRGQLSLESAVGQGTVFRVELPVAEEE